MGPERGLTHHLGAYLSIYTVDNLLGLRDRAVLYNEPGRAAAIFTVRGNGRAKVVLLFRSAPLDIDFGDPVAQHDVLRRRFAGMGWHTTRLIESLPDAYDFYFDEMSQVRLPSWGKTVSAQRRAQPSPGHRRDVDPAARVAARRLHA